MLRALISAQPDDAVALRRARVGAGPELAGAIGRGELVEEALETGGRNDDEHTARPRDDPALSVRNAARGKDEVPGPDPVRFIADLTNVSSP